ncbi:MAG: tetratricopeptide repeat protein, partial [Thermodesulfovibrionales bacterium]|nr:tetratricopeptide repeat protein [Thermodesulfovibrionales bacterium]
YLAKGQVDKAIAEWEKLTKEAHDGSTFNTIGDLYLKKGDKQPAIEAFHKASAIFRNEGFSLKALALYKKILNTNPADGDALFALGELNEEKNIVTDAIKYYLASADIFSKENKRDKLLNAYAKILDLAPANVPLRVKISEMFSKEGFVVEAAREYIGIGNLYDKQGDIETARKYISRALEIQPGSRDALLGMSRISEKSGDIPAAVRYLRTAAETSGEDGELLLAIGRLLIAGGSLDEAITSISKVTEAEPGNMAAKRLLGDVYLKIGNMEKAWEEYNPVIDEMIFKSNYGEAVEVLNTFKEIDPVESSRKLISLFNQVGDSESAFTELLELAGVFEGSGMQVDALKCYQEAYAMRPDNADVKENISRMEKDLGIEPEVQEKTPEEALTEADIFLRYGLFDEARNLLEGVKVRSPENMEVHFKLKALYIDTGDKEQAVTECLILAKLYDRQSEEEKKQAVLNEAYELSPDDPRLPDRAAAGPLAEAPAGAGPSVEDYTEEISEADFYVRQGLIPEAADIYRRLLGIFPGNEELRAKLTDIQGMAEEAGAAAGQPAPVETGETLSLEEFVMPETEDVEAEAMKEPELESDVLEIFEEFKRGLAKDLEAEDFETHYNLGIAYKEMGLLDDAINEFQTAKRDPNFFIQAVTILGMCYMQKGLYQLAVDAFSSALMKIEARDESYWSTQYDLAGAYEKAGSLKEAFQLYTEVYGRNAKFRDVADKVNKLKGEHVKVEHRAGTEAKAVEKDKIKDGYDKMKDKKSRVSYI